MTITMNRYVVIATAIAILAAPIVARAQTSAWGKAGFVAVNGTPHRSSVIVMADQVLAWDVGYAGALNEAAFARLAALPVEILLLGTGPSLSFPHPRLTQPLRDAGIGLEVMDTAAACRTYNILLGEDRRVAAALVVTPAGEHTHA